MERLIDSALVLGFRELPYTADELCQAALETIAANELKQCYICPLIYSGGPQLSLNLEDTIAKVGIAVWKMGSYLGQEALEKGIRANVSSFTRDQWLDQFSAPLSTKKASGSIERVAIPGFQPCKKLWSDQINSVSECECNKQSDLPLLQRQRSGWLDAPH